MHLRLIRTVTSMLLLGSIAMPSLAAEGAALVPRIPQDGPALSFDFPGLRIGIAEYDEGPTGTTVFRFDRPVMATVDVRGGAPGTVNTDGLRLAYDTPFVDAITFAGGSSYGLSAATGVADALKTASDDPGNWANIATVPGAIIFDLGGRRFNAVTPNHALGAAALQAARPGRFLLGGRGAGRFAMQGGYFDDRHHSGQGGAFRQLGPTKVAVFTVVNALGSVVDRDGRIVRCRGAPDHGCGTIAERLLQQTTRLKSASESPARGAPSGNTTITLLLVNQKLPYWALQRLAVQVHTSMARAIQPFATERDGDVLFAVSTAEVDNPALSEVDLGVVAAEVAWDAVLASVPPYVAPPEPAAADAAEPARWDALTGTYEFAQGMTATVSRDRGRLLIQGPTRDNLYLPKDREVELRPVAGTEEDFVLRTPRADSVRFLFDDEGHVQGLQINPGSWAIAARRR